MHAQFMGDLGWLYSWRAASSVIAPGCGDAVHIAFRVCLLGGRSAAETSSVIPVIFLFLLVSGFGIFICGALAPSDGHAAKAAAPAPHRDLAARMADSRGLEPDRCLEPPWASGLVGVGPLVRGPQAPGAAAGAPGCMSHPVVRPIMDRSYTIVKELGRQLAHTAKYDLEGLEELLRPRPAVRPPAVASRGRAGVVGPPAVAFGGRARAEHGQCEAPRPPAFA